MYPILLKVFPFLRRLEAVKASEASCRDNCKRRTVEVKDDAREVRQALSDTREIRLSAHGK